MARNEVRTDVGDDGQGSWVDQAGTEDGASLVREAGVEGHNLMSTGQEPLRHVAAHATQPDHSQFHIVRKPPR